MKIKLLSALVASALASDGHDGQRRCDPGFVQELRGRGIRRRHSLIAPTVNYALALPLSGTPATRTPSRSPGR